MFCQRGYIVIVLIIMLLIGCGDVVAQGMDWTIEQIYNDIYAELVEELGESETLDFEQLVEDLEELRRNPINLNNCKASDLERLRILTDEQIDNILRYVAREPLKTLYELRLIPNLRDYEIRDILPFVVICEPKPSDKMIAREVFKYAKQEADIRMDARNLEGFEGDPLYYSVKYKFNYKNRVQFGLVAERDPREDWWGDFYSGYFQLDEIGVLKRLVVGDYSASFGLGLTLNTNNLIGGKSALLHTASYTTSEGLKKRSSTQEYGFLRGVGTTLQFGKFDLSAFYSARKIDGAVKADSFPTIIQTGYHRSDLERSHKRQVWQQVAGLNVTMRLNHFKLGLTATEVAFSHKLSPKLTYYNADYFRGKNQFAAGANFEWHIRWARLFGEISTAQNDTWGWASVVGTRLAPVEGLTLVALYRYYSNTYDCLVGRAVGENSRNIDENGGYLGIEYRYLPKWKFSLWGDVFYFSQPKYSLHEPTLGYETTFLADYETDTHWTMQWKLRAKQKGVGKYSLRYQLNWTAGGWRAQAVLHGNMASKPDEKLTFGALGYADVRYEWKSCMLQGRVEGFWTQSYNNRFYEYENDVLYAFSIPMRYGSGVRYYVNFRYKITSQLSIYLKVSDTYYTKAWQDEHRLDNAHTTDLHFLLRATW